MSEDPAIKAWRAKPVLSQMPPKRNVQINSELKMIVPKSKRIRQLHLTVPNICASPGVFEYYVIKMILPRRAHLNRLVCFIG